MVDGKARLVTDFYCDGLGACLGHCPQGAITVVEREAEAYNEEKVMHNVMARGPQVVKQHLDHLRDHGEEEYLRQAVQILNEQARQAPAAHQGASCPGSRNQHFAPKAQSAAQNESVPAASALTHWPIQMHLISPMAPQYREAHLLLAADCVAFSLGNFHQKYLSGKTLAIACPKLDQGQEVYLQKLKALIDEAGILSISVMVMQVPCCSGLVQMAQAAMQQSSRSLPLKVTVVGVQGEILHEVDVPV